MAGNQSIRNFFLPAQPAPNVPKPDGMPMAKLLQPLSTNSRGPQPGPPTKPQSDTSSANTKMNKSAPLSSHSSLSPPPSSKPPSFSSAFQRDAPTLGKSTGGASKVEIKGSDDENSDSDTSLPEYGAIFRGQDEKLQPGANKAPTTPRTNRLTYNMHISPIPILSKQKFSLKQLLKESEKDDATEASSKRIKTLDENEISGNNARADSGKHSINEALLESVVAGREEGTMQKVARALKRTEATNVEKRWYFFDTENIPQASKQPFPTKSATESWQQAFSKPETLTSGLAENMVTSMVALGRCLPDELFQWILEEACFESDDVLRHSYFNTIGESGDQLTRLLSPTLIKKLFRNLGASSEATTLSERIMPIPKIETPYSEYNWALLHSLVRFLGRSAGLLRQEARTYAMCLLLRMTIDEMVPKHVDLLELLQGSIRNLCIHIPEENWDSFCQTICTSLFESIKLASLRIHIILTVPSTTPRSHELRRRLAICFFFNSISHCTKSPFTTPPLESFINRLLDRPFRIGPRTDYAELTALVGLLDIAIDNARFTDLDLTDVAAAEQFDADVDELVATIKELTGDIGNPGASYISKIEAKEAMELVSQRFDQTLRTKPKVRMTHFDKLMKKEENLDRERAGMNAFLKPKDSVPCAEKST